jgi:DnaJ-class molecular chaperone
VAGEGDAKQDLSEATHEPRECMACRGTGRVISNLGGSPSTVACPWCEGSGLRLAEIDAQAHWGSEGAEQPERPPKSSGEPAAG